MFSFHNTGREEEEARQKNTGAPGRQQGFSGDLQQAATEFGSGEAAGSRVEHSAGQNN